jgi:hypothetical protein
MSNNKQSSVEWLVNRIKHLIPDDIGSQLFLKSQQSKAKAMHKEEIEKAFYQGADDESNEHGIMYLDMNEAETYYTKTFGGNNEQQ